MVVEAPGPTIFVIDGDPEVTVHRMVAPRWNHREGRHDPLRDPPVVLAIFRIAPCADIEPAWAFDDLEHRPRILQVVLVALRTFEERVGGQLAAMQKGDVAGVNATLHGLQPIAFLQTLRDEAGLVRNERKFPLWQRWLLRGRPHIRP